MLCWPTRPTRPRRSVRVCGRGGSGRPSRSKPTSRPGDEAATPGADCPPSTRWPTATATPSNAPSTSPRHPSGRHPLRQTRLRLPRHHHPRRHQDLAPRPRHHRLPGHGLVFSGTPDWVRTPKEESMHAAPRHLAGCGTSLRQNGRRELDQDDDPTFRADSAHVSATTSTRRN